MKRSEFPFEQHVGWSWALTLICLAMLAWGFAGG
jgi:hypothetical protein